MILQRILGKSLKNCRAVKNKRGIAKAIASFINILEFLGQ